MLNQMLDHMLDHMLDDPQTTALNHIVLVASAAPTTAGDVAHGATPAATDTWSMLFVLVLATFIGLGVILRVSRLLHTPLMSLTNAISAIAVIGAILVTGGDYPIGFRLVGAVALAASTANIVSGFLITNRMLKMFKTDRGGAKP